MVFRAAPAGWALHEREDFPFEINGNAPARAQSPCHFRETPARAARPALATRLKSRKARQCEPSGHTQVFARDGKFSQSRRRRPRSSTVEGLQQSGAALPIRFDRAFGLHKAAPPPAVDRAGPAWTDKGARMEQWAIGFRKRSGVARDHGREPRAVAPLLSGAKTRPMTRGVDEALPAEGPPPETDGPGDDPGAEDPAGPPQPPTTGQAATPSRQDIENGSQTRSAGPRRSDAATVGRARRRTRSGG